MDLNFSTNSKITNAFAALGSMLDGKYIVNENVIGILDDINCKLTCEDQTLRTFRRSIGFSNNIKKDLLPLLINAKDSTIIDATITILVNLTTPIECLFSVDVMNRTDVGRQTVFELNHLLTACKECFTDIKAIRAIVDHLKNILEKDLKTLTLNQCECVNNCLLLLRNILHIPELYCKEQRKYSATDTIISIISGSGTSSGFCGSSNGDTNNTNVNYGNISMQNQIIWNLFTFGIDKLLIYLLSCPKKSVWCITMVQLIALIYKDQHIGALQKLLNVWFEASLSDSSEDFESNTSPQKTCSGDSSSMLTSDSSDNGASNKIHSNKLSEERRQLNPINKDHSNEYKEVIERISVEKSTNKDINRNNTINNNNGKKINHSMFINAKQKSLQKKDDVPERQDQHYVKSTKQNNNKFNFLKPTVNTTKVILTSPQTLVENHCNIMYNNNLVNDSYVVRPTLQTNLHLLGKCLEKREPPPPSSQSELSDYGYGTQIENNQESISTTSSNDDEQQPCQKVHQKPPSCNQKQRYNAVNHPRSVITVQDKKDLRRKKLVKRSRSNVINMKGLLHHVPTDEDISNILKEFTVDFLLKGYGCLVQELHTQLLYESDEHQQIDSSHFFWLIAYFLKFASQLELDLDHVRSVLSFDIISYLTYAGVSFCEHLEMTSRQTSIDLKSCLRRMHLVVIAVKEFLQALDVYKKIPHLSEEDKIQIRLLQYQISEAEDLRCLFILLLRCYNPAVQSKQYLKDLVVTNHMLLLLLDADVSKCADYKRKIVDHIEHFGTVEIMYQYGLLLDDFKENGEFVNDCIFTMMHHVGGDLGKSTTLFQPIILKTYSKIWETEHELCEDWSDLIEYVIHKFINTPQQSSLNLPKFVIDNKITTHIEENLCDDWTQEEIDTLYWYYVQSKNNKDIVGNIILLLIDCGHNSKSRLSVIQQLLQQDIITLVEYDELMKFEKLDFVIQNSPTINIERCDDDIQNLKDRLLKEHKGKFLLWLQKLLIECCFIKLNLKTAAESTGQSNASKPLDVFKYKAIPLHCILKNQSISIIPWTCEQNNILTYEPFMLLLHKLGFHLPADAGKVFIRIPDFWTADMLFDVAEQLGTIDKSILKFDVKLLKGYHSSSVSDNLKLSSNNLHGDLQKCKYSSAFIRLAPNSSPTTLYAAWNWLQEVVLKSENTHMSVMDGSSTASLSIMSTTDSITQQQHSETSSTVAICASTETTKLETASSTLTFISKTSSVLSTNFKFSPPTQIIPNNIIAEHLIIDYRSISINNTDEELIIINNKKIAHDDDANNNNRCVKN